MNQLHADRRARPAVRFGALVATIIAVAAAFIVLAPQAKADPPDLMTFNADNCTMTLEDGYQYKPQDAQDYLDAGTYPAGLFFGDEPWQARNADTQEPVEMNQVDVPVDCLVSATGACGSVTFVGHFPIGADRSQFSVKYGDTDETDEDGEFNFSQAQLDAAHDGYVFSVDTERDPLDWLFYFGGEDSTVLGSTPLATDCDTPEPPAPEGSNAPDKGQSDNDVPASGTSAIPTAAPKSGV